MKIRSKATLTLRAMLARRYGFGLQYPKQPRLWAIENCTSAIPGTPPCASYIGCGFRWNGS